jgi:hypothetical protein
MYVYYMYNIHTYYTWCVHVCIYIYIKITGFLDFKKLQITHQIHVQFTSKHTTNTNGNKLNSSIVLLFVCGVSMFIYVRVYTHWRKTRDWCQHTFASLLYEMMESLRYCNACVKSL